MLEDYCISKSDEEPRIYRQLFEETYRAESSPQMVSGPIVGNFLQLMARITQAKRALDIGTFTGYSALKIAEALPDDGEVYTCDISPSPIAKKYFQRARWGYKVKQLIGNAVEVLTNLKPYFDLAFIDAYKEAYLKTYGLTMELLRRGGVIMLDNMLWSGQVCNGKSKEARSVIDTATFIERDERVFRLLLPIRDGIMLVYKK
jgi:caffeoyl-CoA O-methyltransferase